MPESRPPIALQGLSLADLQALVAAQKSPPVDRWNPTHCGDSHMRIARDGTWYHEESPIRRPAMVRLFSTILRREPDGSHVLVTPVEKLSIAVDATAFRAVAMTTEGRGPTRQIVVQLDSGDLVPVSAEHPLTIIQTDAGPSPRILIRHGLEAELSRALYYEIADLAIADGSDPPGIWSDGQFFALDAR